MKEIAYVTVAFVNSGEKLSKKNYIYSVTDELILEELESLMDYKFDIQPSGSKTSYDSPVVIIGIAKKGTPYFEKIKDTIPSIRSIYYIYDDSKEKFSNLLCTTRRVDYLERIIVEMRAEDNSKEYFTIGSNSDTNTNVNNTVKETNMLNNILNTNDYGKVFGIRFSMYGPAFETEDSKYLSYNKTKQSWVDVTGMTFGDFPFAYAIPVATKMIKKNDFIKHNENWVRVVESDYSKKILKVEDINAKEYKDVIPTVNIFGFNFYTKLMLFGFEGMVPNEDNPFGKLLPFLMLSNEGDTKDLFLLMMMSNADKGTMNFNNPLIMMMLMKDDNHNNDLFSMMMLSSFMNEGTNPFSDFMSMDEEDEDDDF